MAHVGSQDDDPYISPWPSSFVHVLKVLVTHDKFMFTIPKPILLPILISSMNVIHLL